MDIKNKLVMLTIVTIFYVFMCWISTWTIIWPITLLTQGAIGDKAIAILWIVLLIAALN